MSEGQRALLSYVDIGDLFIAGNADDNGWKNAGKELENTSENELPTSVYSGVDRTAFEPAGIALTSEARKIEAATGSAYTTKLFDIDTKYLMIAGYSAFALVLGAGIGSLAYAHNLKAPLTSLKTINDEYVPLRDRTADNLRAYMEKNKGDR